jgi:hypothetical protein
MLQPACSFPYPVAVTLYVERTDWWFRRLWVRGWFLRMWLWYLRPLIHPHAPINWNGTEELTLDERKAVG